MVASPSGFHPVIKMPDEYWVFDFTRGEDKSWNCPYPYQVGRYDEYRPGMYTDDLFGGVRDIHVGVDIGAPVGTAIHAFADGVVHSFGINPEAGSYGPTIVTEHMIKLPISVGSDNYNPEQKVWALHGHLSIESIKDLSVGMSVKAGEKIADVGDEDVNGGWPPHVHFQLSLEEPLNHDMPGVVEKSERESAVQRFPDPRLVLGQLY